MALAIKASIGRSRISIKSNKKYVEYEIDCKVQNGSAYEWSVWKRFSEFEGINAKIKKSPRSSQAVLPPKCSFALDKFSFEFVEQRKYVYIVLTVFVILYRNDLNEYLQQLVALLIEEGCSSSPPSYIRKIKEFLEYEKNTNPLSPSSIESMADGPRRLIDKKGIDSGYSTGCESRETTDVTSAAMGVMKGRMFKRGFIASEWKLRYFVLDHGALQFYGDELCSKILGKYSIMPHCTVSDVPDEFDGRLHVFCFQASTDDTGMLFLSVNDDCEKERWMAALNGAIADASRTVDSSATTVDMFRPPSLSLMHPYSTSFAGNLYVQGHLIKKWKLRHFALAGSVLMFFADEHMTKLSGKFHVQADTEVVNIDSDYQGRPFVFCIQAASDARSKLYLSACDVDEKLEWLRILSEAVQEHAAYMDSLMTYSTDSVMNIEEAGIAFNSNSGYISSASSSNSLNSASTETKE